MVYGLAIPGGFALDMHRCPRVNYPRRISGSFFIHRTFILVMPSLFAILAYSILSMLALANNNGHEVHQMDIDGAVRISMPNSKKSSTCMQLPEIFEKWYGSKTVKLKKALYGLEQSGRAWNLELTASLKKLGWC